MPSVLRELGRHEALRALSAQAGRCRSLGWPFFEEGRRGRLQLSHCSGLNPKEPEVPRKPERQSAEDRRAIRPRLAPRITRKIKRLHGKITTRGPEPDSATKATLDLVEVDVGL
jgi:hypothetical protein